MAETGIKALAGNKLKGAQSVCLSIGIIHYLVEFHHFGIYHAIVVNAMWSNIRNNHF